MDLEDMVSETMHPISAYAQLAEMLYIKMSENLGPFKKTNSRKEYNDIMGLIMLNTALSEYLSKIWQEFHDDVENSYKM